MRSANQSCILRMNVGHTALQLGDLEYPTQIQMNYDTFSDYDTFSVFSFNLRALKAELEKTIKV